MFTVTTGGDFVKRKLSPWCKEVKKTLIDRDMTVTDLCDQVGMCRNYVRDINVKVKCSFRKIKEIIHEWNNYAVCLRSDHDTGDSDHD